MWETILTAVGAMVLAWLYSSAVNSFSDRLKRMEQMIADLHAKIQMLEDTHRKAAAAATNAEEAYFLAKEMVVDARKATRQTTPPA
jgi:hypothetical protein